LGRTIQLERINLRVVLRTALEDVNAFRQCPIAARLIGWTYPQDDQHAATNLSVISLPAKVLHFLGSFDLRDSFVGFSTKLTPNSCFGVWLANSTYRNSDN
jgi:hypothetical protein